MADDDDDYLLGGDDQVDYEGSDYDLDEEEEEEKDDAQENAEAAVGLPPDADGGADAPPAAEQGYRQTEVFKEEEIRPTIPARSVEELRQEPAQEPQEETRGLGVIHHYHHHQQQRQQQQQQENEEEPHDGIDGQQGEGLQDQEQAQETELHPAPESEQQQGSENERQQQLLFEEGEIQEEEKAGTSDRGTPSPDRNAARRRRHRREHSSDSDSDSIDRAQETRSTRRKTGFSNGPALPTGALRQSHPVPDGARRGGTAFAQAQPRGVAVVDRRGGPTLPSRTAPGGGVDPKKLRSGSHLKTGPPEPSLIVPWHTVGVPGRVPAGGIPIAGRGGLHPGEASSQHQERHLPHLHLQHAQQQAHQQHQQRVQEEQRMRHIVEDEMRREAQLRGLAGFPPPPPVGPGLLQPGTIRTEEWRPIGLALHRPPIGLASLMLRPSGTVPLPGPAALPLGLPPPFPAQLHLPGALDLPGPGGRPLFPSLGPVPVPVPPGLLGPGTHGTPGARGGPLVPLLAQHPLPGGPPPELRFELRASPVPDPLLAARGRREHEGPPPGRGPSAAPGQQRGAPSGRRDRGDEWERERERETDREREWDRDGGRERGAREESWEEGQHVYGAAPMEPGASRAVGPRGPALAPERAKARDSATPQGDRDLAGRGVGAVFEAGSRAGSGQGRAGAVEVGSREVRGNGRGPHDSVGDGLLELPVLGRLPVHPLPALQPHGREERAVSVAGRLQRGQTSGHMRGGSEQQREGVSLAEGERGPLSDGRRAVHGRQGHSPSLPLPPPPPLPHLGPPAPKVSLPLPPPPQGLPARPSDTAREGPASAQVRSGDAQHLSRSRLPKDLDSARVEHRDRERGSDRERDWGLDRDGEREREMQRGRDLGRDGERATPLDGARGRDGWDRGRDADGSFGRESGFGRERGAGFARDRDFGRDQDISRDNDRDRDKERSREASRAQGLHRNLAGPSQSDASARLLSRQAADAQGDLLSEYRGRPRDRDAGADWEGEREWGRGADKGRERGPDRRLDDSERDRGREGERGREHDREREREGAHVRSRDRPHEDIPPPPRLRGPIPHHETLRPRDGIPLSSPPGLGAPVLRHESLDHLSSPPGFEGHRPPPRRRSPGASSQGLLNGHRQKGRDGDRDRDMPLLPSHPPPSLLPSVPAPPMAPNRKFEWHTVVLPPGAQQASSEREQGGGHLSHGALERDSRGALRSGHAGRGLLPDPPSGYLPRAPVPGGEGGRGRGRAVVGGSLQAPEAGVPIGHRGTRSLSGSGSTVEGGRAVEGSRAVGGKLPEPMPAEQPPGGSRRNVVSIGARGGGPKRTLRIGGLQGLKAQDVLKAFSPLGSINALILEGSSYLLTFEDAADAVKCRRQMHRATVMGSTVSVEFTPT